jgi:hypothetical protein
VVATDIDLASLTPAVGWMNVERAAFLDRCAGRTDLALALAGLFRIVRKQPIAGTHRILYRLRRT